MTNNRVSSFEVMLECGIIQQVDLKDLTIYEEIGRGTFGSVNKACFRNEIVAVKSLSCIHLKSKQEAENDFIEEVKYLAKVQHQYIVSLFGMTTDKEYLIIEYIEHGSLYNLLHKKKGIDYTVNHAMKWMKQTASAVAYLHRMSPKPIIHRDLKSLNLLLSDYGRVVKICDFGTARYLDKVMSIEQGSPVWMAPEVFTGQNYNEKCDVYSFGIMFWEVLTRKIPFSDLNLQGRVLLFRKVTQGLRPESIDGIPVVLKNLIERCWSQDPNERPSFAEINDFLCYFNQFLTDGWEGLFEQPHNNKVTFDSILESLSITPTNMSQQPINAGSRNDFSPQKEVTPTNKQPELLHQKPPIQQKLSFFDQETDEEKQRRKSGLLNQGLVLSPINFHNIDKYTASPLNSLVEYNMSGKKFISNKDLNEKEMSNINDLHMKSLQIATGHKDMSSMIRTQQIILKSIQERNKRNTSNGIEQETFEISRDAK